MRVSAERPGPFGGSKLAEGVLGGIIICEAEVTAVPATLVMKIRMVTKDSNLRFPTSIAYYRECAKASTILHTSYRNI
jgi:hypothetical protein